MRRCQTFLACGFLVASSFTGLTGCAAPTASMGSRELPSVSASRSLAVPSVDAATAEPAMVEVVERALAHTNADKTEAAYLRSDLFAKRAALMNTWASYIDMPVSEGENVINLHEHVSA